MTEEILHNEFVAASPILVHPSLQSPANGAVIEGSTVMLRCQPHVNPMWHYRIQVALHSPDEIGIQSNRSKTGVARESDFTASVHDAETAAPTVEMEGLAPGDYFWRMRGVQEGRQPSVWSAVWSFTVSEAGE